MANRYAVVTGNWNSTATWDGGTLPGPTDVVRANGFTVTVNQTVTVAELRTDAGGGAAAGGLFITTWYYHITADCYGGTSKCLDLKYGKLTGNCYGGTSSGSLGVYLRYGSLFGNCYGGSGASAYGANLIYGGRMVGDAHGGSGTNAYGAYFRFGSEQLGGAFASNIVEGIYASHGSHINTTSTTSTGWKKAATIHFSTSVVLYNDANAADVSLATNSVIYTPEEFYGEHWPSGGGTAGSSFISKGIR